MEDNNNKNNGLLPNMPSPGTLWASWSVFLGGLGLIGNCMCGPIWGLPAGLILGLLGIACAVLSKKGKPFTQQAQLGLILSILGERNIFSDSPGALLIFRFTPYFSSGSKSTPRNTSI